MGRFELWLRAHVRHTDIFIDGKPYLTRYYLLGGDHDRKVIGARPEVYLHHFHASDPKPGRGLHNHPWEGLSLILWGGYVEERCQDVGTPSVPGVYTEVVERRMVPGRWNRLTLRDFHRATLINERRGCWTLFFAGRRSKRWGFLDLETHAYTEREPELDV